MKRSLLLFSLLFTVVSSFAQDVIVKPEYVRFPTDSIIKITISSALDSLFSGIEKVSINPKYITSKRRALTTSILKEWLEYETSKDSKPLNVQDKQLINIYPISNNQYALSICRSAHSANTPLKLSYIVNLVATEKQGNITFSIPIDYLTRYWKSDKIGNITYYYRDEINNKRAKNFDQKNTEIANKLGLEPEVFDFYMCDNYQEILSLLGLSYAASKNGQYRDGYGVDSNTIFSIMNNEDFSHDIFHYYSGKIYKREERNWVTEEGIANAWGNAYYTDKDGEMILHERLVLDLKLYLSKHPDADLYELFSKNPSIFDHIAPEASVRSTISGLIVLDVEKKKGKNGIMQLIVAGSKDQLKNFLKVTDKLIGLNPSNFNSKIKKLISSY